MEKIKSSRTVFQGKILSVEEVDIDFGSTQNTFELVKFNVETGVSALPIDSQNNVYLVKHFQLGVGERILTLPTGGLNAGEDPAARMQQELQEEIGFQAGKLELMFNAQSIPGYIGTKPYYMYLATHLSASRLIGDEIEEMELHKIPFDQLHRMIKDHQIIDSRVIIAILYYKEFFL